MRIKAPLITILVLSLGLVGCSQLTSPEPTALPTIVPVDSGLLPAVNGAQVVASGEVVPIRTAQLSFDNSGRVLDVLVAEDETVERSQLLAQLEGEQTLEAAVIAAETQVLIAQQALDALDEDIDLQQAAAFQDIVDANQVIGDTQYKLYNLSIPSAYAGMEIKDALEMAKDKLEAARQAFEPYKFKSSGDQTRARLRDEVELARSDFNAIMRRIELEAALITANANLENAERKYETLLEGPDPDEVALAEAQLKDAEAQFGVVRSQLGTASLNAPISGTAVSVDILPGETVLPGQTVVILADLSELRVETTDLSERDVAQVAVGQEVSVYIEALDLDVPGIVARISPGADVVGGDVVYTVLIELDEQPAGLRWGMTVEVNIQTE